MHGTEAAAATDDRRVGRRTSFYVTRTPSCQLHGMSLPPHTVCVPIFSQATHLIFFNVYCSIRM